MRFYSGFAESFYYAYRYGPSLYERARPVKVEALCDAVSRVRDVRSTRLAEAGVFAPLAGPGCLEPSEAGCHHVLVPRTSNRRKTGGLVRHCWDSPIPPGSFVLSGPGIYVSTPEFTFLQLARELDMVSLVLVGCALCASYTLDPKTEKVRGREPITSVERLSCFLKGASGIHGVARARLALRQVADGAESPQEINMFLMMSLPPALGGRGIDGLKLNYVIDVKDTDAGIVDRADRRFARIDMGVPDQNAGAEYLGKHHERQVDADRNRLIFLLAKGERVLQAKYADLSDPVKANRLANQLERILGRGSDEPTPSEMLAREKLSNTLFGAGRMQI